MATVTYVGKQIKRAKVVELTIGSATVGHTFIVTVGGVKAVTYTAVTGDTTATITTNLLALLRAQPDGEFTSLDWAAHATDPLKIVATGPEDGYPFTITATGTGTFTATQTVAPLSPFDAADVLNYSGGALPSAADVLVVEDPDVEIRYGLTALTNAITFRRESPAGGRIGLPYENEFGGYPEYLTQYLEINAVSIFIETTGADQAGAIRIRAMSSSATTVNISGENGAALGQEPVEVYGLPTNSKVWCFDSGVAVAPLATQTAIVTEVQAESSAIRLGSGVTGSPSINFDTCDSLIECPTGTLRLVNGGTCEVGKAATVGLTICHAATILWKSTGAPGGAGSNITLSGGATFDASEVPDGVTTAAQLVMSAGTTYLDPRFRFTWGDIVLDNCKVGDVTIDVGVGRAVDFS